MKKNDGPCLFKKVPANIELTMEIHFNLKAKGKFDHCGLMVYSDPDHWFKTGIEMVDGKPLLGTVVTNTYSDWSAQNWSSTCLRLRVTQKGNGTYIVEALGEAGYQFIRVAQLQVDVKKSIKMGPHGCCPVEQKGCKMEFKDFVIRM